MRRGLARVAVVLVALAGLFALAAFAAAPGRGRPPALPAALLAAAVGPGDPAVPARGASDAVDPDRVVPGADPGGADGATPSASFEEGWQPEGLLGASFDLVASFDDGSGAGGWPARIRPRSELVLDDEPFVERAIVGTAPAPCYHFHRTVREVSVGLADPAGSAIRADLLAWLEPPYFSGVVRSRLDPRCIARPRSQYGFAMEEVYRTPCVVPPGSSVADVRCFVVGQWAYHLGERDTRWSAHLVYDRASGELLLGEDLHVGVDVDSWRAFVDRTVCELGGTCEGVEHRHGQLLATEDALVVWFSPGEAADAGLGTRRLVVPWALVEGLARAG